MPRKKAKKLSKVQIEKDRKEWQAAVHELNAQSQDVKYELRMCEHDSYWYITPVVGNVEEIVVDVEGDDQKSLEWSMVKFSDKQFGDSYHSWSRNPRSSFILNMFPDNSGDHGGYVGRFSYHPLDMELLLARLTTAHSTTIERFGNYEFNEYQRGIYVKEKRVVLIRPYYNPLDGKGDFNPQLLDAEKNELVTNTTVEMLKRNGMPKGTRVIKNVGNDLVKEYSATV